MITNSIWNNELKNNYEKLNKDIVVDILIVGGGLTGINMAYFLKNTNLKVCVIEKNVIGSGVTSKSTAKITYLQDLIYSKICDKYNFDVAKKYYESQIEAIKMIKDIIIKNDIKCDFTRQTSYLFASQNQEIEKIKREKELLIKMGVKIKEIKKVPLNINSYYGISVNDTYYFHPIKYLNELAKICFNNGVSIYENTTIYNFKKIDDYYICSTGDYQIKCKKICIACHYPFFTLPFLFPLRGHIERSYVCSTNLDNKKNSSGINALSNKSFRYYKNNLIYLEGTHNICSNFNVLKCLDFLSKNMNLLNLDINYLWTNEDIITNDYLPYIGLIKDNLYISTGYNTWGMTNSMLGGFIISELIKNQDNAYKNLFNPRRGNNISGICLSIFSNLKPYIANKIIKNKPYYDISVLFTKRNGKDIAIYKDEFNKEHIVYNKCPHLKCSLIFNKKELTWDCPCHSSRFDIDGKCLKGPSNYDITYKEKE